MVIDWLTKLVHFLPIRLGCTLEHLAKMCIDEIFTLHSVLISIVLDRHARFTYQFLESLQRTLGTKIHFGMEVHPQIVREL